MTPKSRGTKPITAALPGMRYGRLTVVAEAARQGRRRTVHCKCDCGGSKTALADNLQSGYTQSCGCFQREQLREALVQHDMTGNLEYSSWAAMIGRCENLKIRQYPRYGGRGIQVCQRWRSSFAAFYADMGPRPTPKHTLGRIDNDGHYEPANCRWETQQQQANNRRTSCFITHGGERRTVAEWMRALGIGRTALRTHIAKGTWPTAKGGEA